MHHFTSSNMSAVNSHDTGEESYSMYPNTSSPPLPAHGNMHFPTYQPPVPMYAYPQVPYMYSGQTPGYPFNMMNQNQMMYQGGGGGIPQGSGVASKKKWNNNTTGNSSGSNHMSSSKAHNYHHHQSTSSYHTNSSSLSSSPSMNSPASKPVALPSRPDQYKFEISKLNSSTSGNTMDFPMFFNTTEEDFAKARAKRDELRLQNFRLNSEQQTVMPSKTKEEPAAEVVETTKTDSAQLQQKGIETPVNSKSSSPAPLVSPVMIAAPTPSPTPSSTTPVAVITPVTPLLNPKATPKSWSAVASSAITKTKQTPNGQGVTRPGSPSTLGQNQSFIQPPQKKEKKYIPSFTKGIEPLGSIALRMCYDPDYIDYTLKNPLLEKELSIKSITPRGIINRANICFMSSVLQVLLYCKPFINILNVVGMRNVNSRVGTTQYKLLDSCINIYRQFDKEALDSEKKPALKGKQQQQPNVVASMAEAIKPDEFYNALSTIPKFKDLKWGHQEDAEEFLTHLLDQLHEEFISSIDSLADNEIQNLLLSINDEELKVFFIRNLPRYKKAEFIKNASVQLKNIITKYGCISEDSDEDGNGWHEVSGTSKKGKRTKTAAKRTVEMEPSPMSCLFGGQFRSVLDIPNNKESQSITLDPFQTIQLDISDKSVNDLETAFKKFSEYELLPFKSSSGNDVEAKKQTFIDKLPQVLLIQLKRFQFINNTEKDNSMVNYNAYSGRIEKIRKKILYDHELIIPAEVISSINLQGNDSRRYNLTGVIYHHGLSSDGGHYTADVYHKETDKWYRIDDVNITELQKDDVLKGGEDGADSRTAYILVYQKN